MVQYKVSCGHKVVMFLSLLGFILMVTTLCIPGWVRMKFRMMPNDPGLFIDKMTADSSPRMERNHHEHHRHFDSHDFHDHGPEAEDEIRGFNKEVRISAGMFYMSVCSHHQEFRGRKHCRCQWVPYCHARKYIDDMPEELREMGMADVYSNLEDNSKWFLLEIHIEVLVGAVTALIAAITGLVYVRNVFERRRTGVTTVLTHIMSGVLFSVVVGRVMVSTIQMRYLMDHNPIPNYQVQFHFPYAQLIGGLGAVLMLTSSFCLLLTLSKGSRYSAAMPYIHTTAASGLKFGILSPPEYQLEEDKILPCNLAEPLPEKVPLS